MPLNTEGRLYIDGQESLVAAPVHLCCNEPNDQPTPSSQKQNMYTSITRLPPARCIKDSWLSISRDRRDDRREIDECFLFSCWRLEIKMGSKHLDPSSLHSLLTGKHKKFEESHPSSEYSSRWVSIRQFLLNSIIMVSII